MIGHLGPRVSALSLDGQLTPAEAERAWAHVHACHFCRDAVEREGWVKTRLAGLGGDATPPRLKGALAHGGFLAASHPIVPAPTPHRPRSGAIFLGGTAVGAAVVGVLALGSLRAGRPSNAAHPSRA